MSMAISPIAPRASQPQSVPVPPREAPGAQHASNASSNAPHSAPAAPGGSTGRSATLSAMAREHGAGAAGGAGQAAQAGPSSQTPLDAKVRATDQAVASFTQAQGAYRAVAARTDANPDLVKTLRVDADHARAHVKQATGDELNLRASALQTGARPPAETHYRQAGQAITQRYAGQPAQQALLKDTLDGLIQQRFAGTQSLANTPALVEPKTTGVSIRTGNADDRVHISQSSKTGEVTIDVNGQKHTYTQKQAEYINIQTAGGNDTIRVDANVNVKIWANGGAGNDVIYGGGGDDRLLGGSGDDIVNAGDGHDYVDAGAGNDMVWGGKGSDTLYGGEGNDVVHGGAGKDYLDGYLGHDILTGGAGDDVLSGGQGNDRLEGGAGNDVTYAGKGTDQITDQSGSNRVYHQAQDKVQSSGINTLREVMAIPPNITIEGSAEFKARTQADLETLAASPAGQQMLETIKQEGRGLWGTGLFGDKLTISELQVSAQHKARGEFFDWDTENGKYVPRTKEVRSNPAFHLGDGPESIYGRVPPIMVLYHEMGHAQADMNGTSITPYLGRYFQDNTNPGDPDHNSPVPVPDEERRNVGLPRDHDNNPNTKAQMDDRTPYALTENGLREEMGYPKRGSYAMP